jgi:hypothetical protein
MSTASTVSVPGRLARDVAALLDVDATTVRRWRRAGLFPNAYRRDLRAWLIPDPDIAAVRAVLNPPVELEVTR